MNRVLYKTREDKFIYLHIPLNKVLYKTED